MNRLRASAERVGRVALRGLADVLRQVADELDDTPASDEIPEAYPVTVHVPASGHRSCCQR